MLNATVMDLRYNDTRYSGPCTVQFYDVDANGYVKSLGSVPTSTGVATLPVQYNSSGTLAHAYKAVAKLTGGTIQVISNPVQLTVGCNTTLLLNVTRDFDSTRHVFLFRLLSSGGSSVYHKNITLTLNNTVYSSEQYPSLRTNPAGYAWIALYLTPPAGGNLTYNEVASFAGDSASTATATMTTLNGTTYDVCTTTQYSSDEPCSNSTSITVTPQTTTGATTLVDMAAMQQKAENDGLEVWGPDSWSIFPPFFKLHARVLINSLGTDVQNWVGLFACGVDSYLGLIFPLHKALENLTAAEIDIAVSAITSVTAGVTTLYWLNMIAAEVSELSLVDYFMEMIVYATLLLTSVLTAASLPNVWLSRALLYGIGFALLALTLGSFSNDPQARFFPSEIRLQLPPATDPVTTGIKCIVNSFLIGAITASNMILASIVMLNPLMWPFAVITFAVAVMAIYLGSTR
jgi:hypothetical protein